jgi:hypothetical protein
MVMKRFDFEVIFGEVTNIEDNVEISKKEGTELMGRILQQDEFPVEDKVWGTIIQISEKEWEVTGYCQELPDDDPDPFSLTYWG